MFNCWNRLKYGGTELSDDLARDTNIGRRVSKFFYATLKFFFFVLQLFWACVVSDFSVLPKLAKTGFFLNHCKLLLLNH